MSVVLNSFLFNFFKGKRWIVDLVLITIIVYFLALSAIVRIKGYFAMLQSGLSVQIKSVLMVGEHKIKPKQEPLSALSAILNRDLFGAKVIPKPIIRQKRVVINNIPISQRLGLKLVGTIVGIPESYSRAIIYNSKTAKYMLLKVGDKIGTASLEKVLRDQVILNINGKRERLVVKNTESNKKFKEKLSNVRAINTASSLVKSVSGNSVFTLSRDAINRAFDDLPSLLSGATAVPYRRGNVSGFILRDVRPGSIYSKIGLKKGDIITDVDGHALQNTSQLMQLYNDVRNQTEIHMDVVRGGQKKTLTYYLE
jgi:type II secretion system protein C